MATILLVDDDHDFLTQMDVLLRGVGFETVLADSAASAWEQLQKRWVDLAVIDLMLEHTDSGFTLCHQIKARTETPIILVSSVVKQTGMEFDASTDEERSWIKAEVMLDKPVDASVWTRRVAHKPMHWEAKHIACTRKFSAEAGALRTMIAELYGDEGYDLIEKAYGSLAEAEYQLGRQRGHIKEPEAMTPIEAAKFICFLYDVNGRAPLVFPEISDDRVVIQHSLGIPKTCNYCARQGDWRMCNVETAFERNLVKLMNPKLRARRTKGKIYGDYGCELVVEWDR